MSALANLLLRTIVDPDYQTKGSTLTFEELDGNLVLLADCIAEAIGGATAGILPYDNATEYSAGNGLASFVTYQGNTWEYINPTPSTGNAPDINDGTYWSLRSTGAFSHAQNTDTGTNSNSFAIGDGIAGDKSVIFENGQAGANRPSLKWNETEGYFELIYSGGLVRKVTDHKDLQNSLLNYDPSPAGTPNAITATFDPAIDALVDGLRLYFKVDSNNTGAATIDIDGLGAQSIVRPDGTPLKADDLKAGAIAEIFYDGTNFRFLGLGVVTAQNIQNGAFVYSADTGAANAYVIAPDPAITAYIAGQEFNFKASIGNTGGSTVNVNGLGLKSIVRRDGTALQNGDIPADSICKIVYDGTNFQLVSASAGGGGGGASTIFERAFTISPDLDTVISPYIVVTPVQLTRRLSNGVTTLTYRSRLDDGVDSYVDRADLTALNTYLAGLADDVAVDIEVTANPTKVCQVVFVEDRS